MSHPVPFMKASSVAAPKKAAKEMPDLEEAIEEEDEGDVLEPVEAEDDDLSKDKYIKQPKAKAKRAPKKAAKAAAEDDADEDEVKPPKGRGRPKASAPKGKVKK